MSIKAKERKEKIVSFMAEEAYKPLLFNELVTVLDVPKEEVSELKSILDTLENEGKIFKTRKERYGIPERMGLVAGRIQGHEKGFAFLIPDNIDIDDVFIPASSLNGALHQDRVIVRLNNISSENRRAEGEVINILTRASNTIVGTFEYNGKFGFVVPDNSRISTDVFIAKEQFFGAFHNDKVIVEITKWPVGKRNAEGKVIEVIGNKDAPGIDILSIVKSFGLSQKFPQEVNDEAEKVVDSVTQDEVDSRKDLRETKMVTIDGEDAKDLDDAISLEILENGIYRLGVHIADVSHYVRENTELDKEALKRGTSVYLVDRVIPMLPKKLSNGICSLNSGVDRLAFSVIMDVNNNGEVVNHEIFESVINVDRRMTYKNVYKILEQKDQDLISEYSDFVDFFKDMKELSLILRKKRNERGAIDFDFEEAKIIVDEKGNPIEIKKYEITIANKIIEEFMLLCNETVSEHFFWADIPFVYRIHEDPDPEKIEALNNYLFNLGIHIKGINNIHPRALQDVLEKIKGTKYERVISTVMLRSLQKARYSDNHARHFGLAANYYSHFTSPIRRYPDLIIHRIMKEYIKGGFQGREEHYDQILPEITSHCSIKERSAEEAERDCDNMKKAEYMKKHVGEVYEGVISGITSFGLFVELDNTIEGMIRISSLEDDYYNYNQDQYCLVGERTGRIFGLGDEIRIQVVSANSETRQIEFAVYEGEEKETTNKTPYTKRVGEKKYDEDTIIHIKGKSKKKKHKKTKKSYV